MVATKRMNHKLDHRKLENDKRLSRVNSVKCLQRYGNKKKKMYSSSCMYIVQFTIYKIHKSICIIIWMDGKQKKRAKNKPMNRSMLCI